MDVFCLSRLPHTHEIEQAYTVERVEMTSSMRDGVPVSRFKKISHIGILEGIRTRAVFKKCQLCSSYTVGVRRLPPKADEK